MTTTAWQEGSACKNADPDLFHPKADAGRPYARARAICTGCPVVAQCLEYALSAMTSDRSDETSHAWGRYGYWGNTTPEERERIHLARQGRAA